MDYGITRNETKDGEREERHEQDSRYEEKKTAGDILSHGVPDAAVAGHAREASPATPK